MKRLTQADRVIVVLSDKYLHSLYCMAELYGIYQDVRQKKQEFLNRMSKPIARNCYRGRLPDYLSRHPLGSGVSAKA